MYPGTQIPRYPDTQVPRYQVPRYQDTKIPRYPGTQIPGTKIPRYPDTQVPRYQVPKIPRYQDTQVSRYPDTRYQDTQVPRYPDTQVPRYPTGTVIIRFHSPVPITHKRYFDTNGGDGDGDATSRFYYDSRENMRNLCSYWLCIREYLCVFTKLFMGTRVSKDFQFQVSGSGNNRKCLALPVVNPLAYKILFEFYIW